MKTFYNVVNATICCAKEARASIVLDISLPADVLWGSFVTHSFLPHGRLLNTADIYVLDCLNKPISG